MEEIVAGAGCYQRIIVFNARRLDKVNQGKVIDREGQIKATKKIPAGGAVHGDSGHLEGLFCCLHSGGPPVGAKVEPLRIQCSQDP